ncbi:MAG: GPR endopeptidase [Defluviitaleaceae bacterium]|nr:GPR endopeptidase [Defluviitaleaceae bacterium]
MRRNMDIYTDLALEAADSNSGIDGVSITSEEDDEAELVTTTVEIETEEAAKKLGKPIGTYITLESDMLMINEPSAHELIIKTFARKLGQLHNLEKHHTVMVVGLGNWNVTPDALGPKTIARVLVTRHITCTDAVASEIEDAVRPVCAVTPGVMGLTGIETSEIVRGIVEKVKPDMVIAIDALAARSIKRINCTVQMSNTGVNPGAGLGNKRVGLNRKTLGVPVIAIGVPTVVDAATLISDTLDVILEDMIAESGEKGGFYKTLQELADQEKYAMIQNALAPYAGNMFVTPKEVDAVIGRLAGIIANSLNIALHPGITQDDINKYF